MPKEHDPPTPRLSPPQISPASCKSPGLDPRSGARTLWAEHEIADRGVQVWEIDNEMGGAWVHQDEQGDSEWVLWADNGQRGDIEIWLPVSAPQVTVVAADGEQWTVSSQDGEVPIVLEGSARYSRTLMVLDQE